MQIMIPLLTPDRGTGALTMMDGQIDIATINYEHVITTMMNSDMMAIAVVRIVAW